MEDVTKKYNCAILDDDLLSVEIMIACVSRIPELVLVNSYTDPLLAIDEILKGQRLDFLFLDINMNLSGLDVASILRDQVGYIIFVTGYPEHALAAFEVSADNFLVKPVDFHKFHRAVKWAIGAPSKSIV